MKQLIDSRIGMYMVLEVNDHEPDFIKPQTVELCSEILTPGGKTTLTNHFTKPVEFAGVRVDDELILCFYLGDDEDLFTHRRFYDCYYIITPSRLFKKYSELSGRDYNFINNRWK